MDTAYPEILAIFAAISYCISSNSMDESKSSRNKSLLLLSCGLLILLMSAVAVFAISKSSKNDSIAGKNNQSEKEMVNTDSNSPSSSDQTNTTGSNQHVSLNFSQKFIDASKNNETVNVDIILDTESAKTDGAIVEVVYDPESISDVDLFPAFDTESLYGEQSDVTTLSHSPEEGKFVLGISTSAEQEGTGRIATLSFKTLKSSSKDKTQITFSRLSEGYSGSEKYPADPGSLEVKIK